MNTLTIAMTLVGLVAGGTGGIFVGTKVPFWTHERIPSNEMRIDDAQTDVRLAELAVNKRRHEAELELSEVQLRKKLEHEERGHLELTTGLDNRTAEQQFLEMCFRLFPNGGWRDYSNLDDLIDEFEDEVKTKLKDLKDARFLGDKLYHYIFNKKGVALTTRVIAKNYGIRFNLQPKERPLGNQSTNSNA